MRATANFVDCGELGLRVISSRFARYFRAGEQRVVIEEPWQPALHRNLRTAIQRARLSDHFEVQTERWQVYLVRKGVKA